MMFCDIARAALIIIDDFEFDEGHFTTTPSFSGSTQGETETAPGVGPSTADRDTTQGFLGTASQFIFMDDDPVTFASGDAWRLRNLSGTGVTTSNTPLSNTSGETSYVGYFLKTMTPNLEASLLVDDVPAGANETERALFISIIPDGEWHLYEWQLQDADQWFGFAGATANGTLDAATVTIDGIYIRALLDANIPDQDGTLNIDTVSYDQTGPIVPEPSSMLLLIASMVSALAWSRRVWARGLQQRL